MNKILIIEDNHELLESLTTILQFQDYQVMAKSDASRVWKDIDQFNPDLLLLDVWLEPVDGDQIAHSIKTSENLKNLPVILISAADNLKTLSEKVNADDYLKKPFDLGKLLSKVNYYLNNN